MSTEIAFIMYNSMTTLDWIGAYDPLTRLRTMGFRPELRWEICAYTEEVTDSTGLRFVPTQVRLPLEPYDSVFVSGGMGSRDLLDDVGFIAWLRSAAPCGLKVSVCTGSLLLGAAGLLKGKRATTHPQALDELRRFCSVAVDQRIVDEGEVVTAGGVTAAMDLGLYLCRKLVGPRAEAKIRRQMDYWAPPASGGQAAARAIAGLEGIGDETI